MTTQKQKTAINLAVFYGLTIVFTVFLFISNPLEIERVEANSLYDLSRDSVSEDVMFAMTVREFYTTNRLVITEDVAEILLPNEAQFRFVTGIDSIEIVDSLNDLTVLEGNDIISEFTTKDDVLVRFIKFASDTIFAFQTEQMIVVVGQ